MVRLAGVAFLLCILFAAPAAARAVPPHCPDAALLTPVNTPLELPTPDCTGVTGTFTFEIVPGSEPAHGTITGNPRVYRPNTGFHDIDQFRYTITDQTNVKSNEATVQILADTPPTCRSGTATVAANGRLVLPDLDCSDADGDQLITWVDDPQHGTTAFPDDGSVVYTPTPGYVGPDAFVYWAEENVFGVTSYNATMAITVTAPAAVVIPTPIPVVRAPVAAPKLVADLSAPVIKLKDASKKQAASIALTTSENSTATLTLTLDKATARKLKLSRTVGQVKAALTPGTATIAVKLSAKARKAFKNLKRVKLTLIAVVVDTAGNSTTRTVAVTLKK
jgi:hypothetical protein